MILTIKCQVPAFDFELLLVVLPVCFITDLSLVLELLFVCNTPPSVFQVVVINCWCLYVCSVEC